ncbi:MAG: hypothetical protein ACFE9S_10885 [Candidatus Hermodarchaeota archaeon]
MNEDREENYGDNFEENKDFKEFVDIEFEPMDKTCEKEEIFDNFEPRDEIINETSIDKFKPREYINNDNYSTGKKNHTSENIELETHQKLYNNGRVKECGRFHQIKPYEEYGTRKSLGKKRLFSRCKECRIEINQIYQYKNKLKIIQNLYNGKLKDKCQICSTDIKRLPSLEFDHTNPRLKRIKRFS